MALQEMTCDEILLSRGLEQGRQEGRLNLLMRQLEARFGALDPELRERLRRLDSGEEVERLGERVLTASSLEEMGLPG